MQYKIVKHPPQRLDLDALLKCVHLDDDSEPEDIEAFCALCDEALEIAEPVALYAVAPIDTHGDTFIECADIRFSSELMAKNLADCDVCVPYVVSCGVELMEWAKRYDADFLKQFWADTIMIAFLDQARKALSAEMDAEVFRGAKYASMNPGSLKQWTIDQQAPLFALLGGVAPHIGVRLTPEFLMVPAKSGSGIFFTNEKGFVNCRLCPRENCPNRRVPYDPAA